MFSMDELSSVAKKHVLRHFTYVRKEDEFLSLPVNLLSDLLSEENLSVVVEDLTPCVEEREKMILETVLQYVEELRLFRPKACSPDGDSPEAKDDSPDDTNQ